MPTVLTLQSVAKSAETGQSVPLVATVNAAGTARQVKAAQSETITGTVEFFIDSPHPIILGKVALNTTNQSSIPFLSTIESTFGVSMGAVTFGKAGAETLQVTQADDSEVSGKTTFAIA